LAKQRAGMRFIALPERVSDSCLHSHACLRISNLLITIREKAESLDSVSMGPL
jgi:hypothetical protein